MNYNDEQFEALARFEGSFRSAIDSNYAPHPGYDAMKEIRGIYIAATGALNVPEDYGCSSCVIRILRKAGRLWLEDKQARIDASVHESRFPLDYFVRKYEITYEEAKAAAERIGVEVVDGEVPAINSEDISQEIREHVLGLPGGFAGGPAEECDETTLPKPKKSTKKAAKK